MDTALLTLAHLLVLVYWLGGDLGAFYASTILTNPAQPAAGRLAAARVLANVDMAPRTALILAFPTGAALAARAGYWQTEAAVLALIWALALAWLVLVWVLHLRHGGAPVLRSLDLVLRWIVALSLLALANPMVGPRLGFDVPLFLHLKCLMLALAILCGLVIRALLGRFGAALGAMAERGASPATDLVIRQALDRARPTVIAIWALILTAAFLGIARPIGG